MSRTHLFVIVLLLVCAVAAVPAGAQTISGAISGTVLDSSGAVLPNARIVIKNIQTGLTRETATDASGFFRVPALPIGEYSVTASASNFETVTRVPIRVETSIDRTLEMTLKPARTQEVVTVEEEAPLIQTTQSQLSKSVDEKRIMALPGLNTQTGLALLQAGAMRNNNSRPGSGFAINGGRTRSNFFGIDGANNNDQSLSIPRQSVPPEALQEFNIITNNYSAQYGRNSGSYVNQITKSGTNDFHGTVRWTWQGNSYNALTPAQERTYKAQRAAGRNDLQALRAARGVVVENLGAGSLGGPIAKDRAFFFVSHDRDWYRTTAVPTPAVAISPQGWATLQANASAFVPGTLDFLQRTFPLANDPTVRGTINIGMPSGSTIAVPLHQFNRSLTGALPFKQDFYRWMAKVDTRPWGNDTLTFRYLMDDLADAGSPSAIPGNEVGNALRNQSATISQTHIFSPSTINEARGTYARRAAGFPENLPPAFGITGFQSVGNINFPQFRKDNVYEVTDNISMLRGSHSLKTGFNFLRYQLNSFFAPLFRGNVSYPSLADFLFDRNASFQQYAGEGYLPARTTELAAFFQDDWRTTSALTLNLGIRWEYTGAPFGYFSNAKPDINNFAPRLGFAWSPRPSSGFLRALTGNGRMSVRGGWSLAYDQVFQNILLNVARNYPRGVNVTLPPTSGQRYFDPARRPAVSSPAVYVSQGNDPLQLPVRLYSANKRISQPYSQQYSLGIERQFLTNYAFKLFYVGSRAVDLVREVETNIGFTAAAIAANPSTYSGIISSLQPVRNAAGTITAYRMDPTRGSVVIGDGLAQSTYHSMQMTVEKRFSRGLQFEVNYTYSSFINDSDDILGGQANNTLPAVPFNFRLDRGRSGFDVPHRLVANYVWEIPSYNNGAGFLGRVLGGWQVSGITEFASGTPYTILNGNNALGILPGAVSTVEFSQRASVNLNGTRPLPTSATVGASAYFVANGTNSGIIGTAGRNTERTAGINLWDFALSKNTRIHGERHSIQFRFDLFNAFNHRNFTLIPLNTVNNSTDVFRFMNLGQTSPTGTLAGRTMYFSLRYMF